MYTSFKGNNSIIMHNSAHHHNSIITRSRSIIKDLIITYRVEVIRETEEAMEEEDLEEVYNIPIHP
jgi:hypothetical protein